MYSNGSQQESKRLDQYEMGFLAGLSLIVLSDESESIDAPVFPIIVTLVLSCGWIIHLVLGRRQRDYNSLLAKVHLLICEISTNKFILKSSGAVGPVVAPWHLFLNASTLERTIEILLHTISNF